MVGQRLGIVEFFHFSDVGMNVYTINSVKGLKISSVSVMAYLSII